MVPTAPVEHNGRTLYGSARLDLSELCRPKDLVIFEETAEGAEVPFELVEGVVGPEGVVTSDEAAARSS